MKNLNHSNIIEVLGRNHLITQLMGDDVHAAVPLWDQGVDLVAYYAGAERLVARPLQLKVAEDDRWGLQKKYAEIQDLLIVYIWHVKQARDVQIYAMSYAEAENLLTTTSTYAQSDSWTKRGNYHIAPVGTDLLAKLQPFLMTEGKWRARLARP